MFIEDTNSAVSKSAEIFAQDYVIVEYMRESILYLRIARLSSTLSK